MYISYRDIETKLAEGSGKEFWNNGEIYTGHYSSGLRCG